jgi:hypothetical protein
MVSLSDAQAADGRRADARERGRADALELREAATAFCEHAMKLDEALAVVALCLAIPRSM